MTCCLSLCMSLDLPAACSPHSHISSYFTCQPHRALAATKAQHGLSLRARTNNKLAHDAQTLPAVAAMSLEQLPVLLDASSNRALTLYRQLLAMFRPWKTRPMLMLLIPWLMTLLVSPHQAALLLLLFPLSLPCKKLCLGLSDLLSKLHVEPVY